MLPQTQPETGSSVSWLQVPSTHDSEQLPPEQTGLGSRSEPWDRANPVRLVPPERNARTDAAAKKGPARAVKGSAELGAAVSPAIPSPCQVPLLPRVTEEGPLQNKAASFCRSPAAVAPGLREGQDWFSQRDWLAGGTFCPRPASGAEEGAPMGPAGALGPNCKRLWVLAREGPSCASRHHLAGARKGLWWAEWTARSRTGPRNQRAEAETQPVTVPHILKIGFLFLDLF